MCDYDVLCCDVVAFCYVLWRVVLCGYVMMCCYVVTCVYVLWCVGALWRVLVFGDVVMRCTYVIGDDVWLCGDML